MRSFFISLSRSFAIALSFLTIIPGGRNLKITGETLSRSTSFFPVVGCLLGFTAVSTAMLFKHLTGAHADFTACILLFTEVLLTGGLHVDAVGDFCDAFFCTCDRQKRLEILKDSRLGTFGVVGILFSVGVKFLLIRHIADSDTLLPVVYSFVLSRWAMVLLMHFSSSARKDGESGLADEFLDKITGLQLAEASVITLGIGFAFMNWSVFPLVLAAVMITFAVRTFSNYMILGITGDVIGTLNELVSLTALGWILAVCPT